MADYYPRREILLRSSAIVTGIAAGAAVAQLPTCSSSGGGINIQPIIDTLQKAVAQVCNIVPSVATLLAVVTASFPQLAGATTVAENVVNEVTSTICKLIQTQTASGKLGAEDAVVNGKSIPLHGYQLVDGKMVWF